MKVRRNSTPILSEKTSVENKKIEEKKEEKIEEGKENMAEERGNLGGNEGKSEELIELNREEKLWREMEKFLILELEKEVEVDLEPKFKFLYNLIENDLNRKVFKLLSVKGKERWVEEFNKICSKIWSSRWEDFWSFEDWEQIFEVNWVFCWSICWKKFRGEIEEPFGASNEMMSSFVKKYQNSMKKELREKLEKANREKIEAQWKKSLQDEFEKVLLFSSHFVPLKNFILLSIFSYLCYFYCTFQVYYIEDISNEDITWPPLL